MLYTLVTEGSDDRVLERPINWLLERHCVGEFSGQWANPAALDDKSRDLKIRMAQVERFFPADIYFVHRDTDVATRAERVKEINDALAASGCHKPVVCVIPVRMTEAWLLFHEAAIRRAADNVRGRIALRLPTADEAQRRADPKALLEEKLIAASELSGRRLAQFRGELSRRKALVANAIDDYAPLRRHASFQSLEDEIVAILRQNSW